MISAEIAFIATVLAALIGAVSSSWITEAYKRYRDRRALAFALAGELASHLEALSSDAIQNFCILAEAARKGSFPGLMDFEGFDLVYDRNVDKLGLLEGDFPERLVKTYGRIKASRMALQQIARGAFAHDHQRIATTIEYHLMQWQDHVIPDGRKLIQELKFIGRNRFPL